jgi:two-component system NtrC family sensor kinase
LHSNNILQLVLRQLSIGIVILDQEYCIHFWNHFMEVNSGIQAEDVFGKRIFEVFSEPSEPWIRKKIDTVVTLGNMSFTSWQQRPYLFPFPSSRPVTGHAEKMFQDITFFPMRDPNTQTLLVGILISDATGIAIQHQELEVLAARLQKEKTEQTTLIQKLEAAQAQLLQSEKMAAVGQLAAGIAHEINNPMAFVTSNINSFETGLDDLMALIDEYDENIIKPGSAAIQASAQQLKEKYDFDFLMQDLKDLIAETKEGADRVKKIVQDLKDFSHVSESEWQLADLHKGLDSTLNVIWNEIKYKAEVVKHYGDIPAIECIASQLNQVFMNLIINASHAIENKGIITITTRMANDNTVTISVKDDGHGIDKQNLARLFEPFFTTKPVGKGTGLGLSLSYNIIKKHQGKIEVKSEPGTGTEFTIVLPVKKTQPENINLP